MHLGLAREVFNLFVSQKFVDDPAPIFLDTNLG